MGSRFTYIHMQISICGYSCSQKIISIHFYDPLISPLVGGSRNGTVGLLLHHCGPDSTTFGWLAMQFSTSFMVPRGFTLMTLFPWLFIKRTFNGFFCLVCTCYVTSMSMLFGRCSSPCQTLVDEVYGGQCIFVYTALRNKCVLASVL